jgi:hypothetical protein
MQDVQKTFVPQVHLAPTLQCLTRSSLTGVLQVQGCSPAMFLLEGSISGGSTLTSDHLLNLPNYFTPDMSKGM